MPVLELKSMSQPSNRKLVTQQMKYRMRPNEESIRITEEVDRDGLNDSIANRNGIIVSSQHINSEIGVGPQQR